MDLSKLLLEKQQNETPTFNTIFKNKIINGCFRVNQRGLGPFGGNVYSSDRWFIDRADNALSVVEETINGEAVMAAEMSVTIASDDVYLQQGIELPRAGEKGEFTGTWTSSVWIKSNAIGIEPVISIYWSDDADITNSSQLTRTDIQRPATDGTWQKYVFQHDLDYNDPIPSSACVALRVDSVGAITSSDTFSIAKVQFEKGSVATDFEQRPLSIEEQLCQRYYYQSTSLTEGSAFASFGNITAGESPYYSLFRFNVQMRDNPEVIVLSAGESGAGFQGIVNGDVLITDKLPKGFLLNVVGKGNDSGGSSYYVHFYADAEL